MARLPALLVAWLALCPLLSHALTLRHALHHPVQPGAPVLIKPFDAVTLMAHEDVYPDAVHDIDASRLKSVRRMQARPNTQEAFQAARRASALAASGRSALMYGRDDLATLQLAETLEWEETEVVVPDVSDVGTLNLLGKMTSNAYVDTDDPKKGWYDLARGFNVTDSFGWLEDGLRGHIYADESNSTVVVAIKGTSATFIGGGGGTGHNDKTNDNLLFSCCCARVDWSWSTVCDCYGGSYQCSQNCLEQAVVQESAYYPIATNLFNNITALYPSAQIWLTGHSLGGGLAALLSATYFIPSVSFESPGDLLPAKRLHLPLPPPELARANLTTHVYHTADPIPQGVCTGSLSLCSVAGFALESRCHSGHSIIYDSVAVLGWSVDVRTHRIVNVIEWLLVEEWGKGKGGGGGGTGPDPGPTPEPPDEPPYVMMAAGQGRQLRLSAEDEEHIEKWWPGRKKKPGQDDDPEETDKEGRGVPAPIWEQEDCIDCFRWTYQ